VSKSTQISSLCSDEVDHPSGIHGVGVEFANSDIAAVAIGSNLVVSFETHVVDLLDIDFAAIFCDIELRFETIRVQVFDIDVSQVLEFPVEATSVVVLANANVSADGWKILELAPVEATSVVVLANPNVSTDGWKNLENWNGEVLGSTKLHTVKINTILGLNLAFGVVNLTSSLVGTLCDTTLGINCTVLHVTFDANFEITIGKATGERDWW